MANEISGIILGILNELSSNNVGSTANTRKQRTRRFICAISFKIAQTSNNDDIKEAFAIAAQMARLGGNYDSELIQLFSQLAAIVMVNELSSASSIQEFEHFLPDIP